MLWFHWLFLTFAFVGILGIASDVIVEKKRDAAYVVFCLILILIVPLAMGFKQLWVTLSF